MDVVPTVIDNQVVCHLKNPCKGKGIKCRCIHLILCIHNWSIINQLPYLILDFQEEKHVCPTFIEELVFLKRRLTIPVLLIGLGHHSKEVFERYDFSSDFQEYHTPKEAFHALAKADLTDAVETTSILSLGREIMGEWSLQVEL